ncbi:MAG: glutaminase A, partial [Pseudomonadota bacterium]
MIDHADIDHGLDRLHDALAAARPAIAAEAQALRGEGRVADYIPALARAPRDAFGLAIAFADGRELTLGDAEAPFSIQSVSKVFSLAFALDAVGEALWERVGREPSGMAFNSLVLLEMENGAPRNPLINAGAIVTMDALLDVDAAWAGLHLAQMRRLAEDESVHVDAEVHASERAHGDLNRAIAWFLKAKGNLRTHPDTATDAYFSACATAMSCRQLASAGRFLIGPEIGPHLCRAPERRRRIRAVMRTCGLYDAAGDFAYRVGLPAKSGVGGGVLAIAPGRCAIAAWAPPLDAKGNS